MGKDSVGPRPVARKPRGFLDKSASLLRTERRLIETISETYERWGFEALDTGPFEYVDALGKFLPDTDRPNEGVFALQDDDEQWMALRYDHTAPLARYVAENWDRLPKPYRRYASGPVWRNEKPGPFRFREFLQCDADVVGAIGAPVDAEMVALAVDVMEQISVGRFEVRINTRKLLDGVLEGANCRDPAQKLLVLRALDKLDRLGTGGVADLLGKGRRDESGDETAGAGLSPAQIDQLIGFASARGGSRSETLSNLAAYADVNVTGAAGLVELRAMDEVLTLLGVDDHLAVYDPAIVRGLEYYTGPVLEIELLSDHASTPDGPRTGSVGSGGRYDDLVARFRGETVPSTGVSFGVTRLAQILNRAETRQGPVVVLVISERDAMEACLISSELRRAGIAAETYVGSSSMRAQMKYADKRSAPAVVICGEDERSRDVVMVKDLAAGATAAASIGDNSTWRQERPGQVEAPRSQVVDVVRSVIERWS